MNFHQFLLALKGRIWVFLGLLAATVFAAIVVTILMPKTYEATASVLVDNRDEQMINAQMMPARAQLGYMQTQVDIIQSQRVAKQVVRDLKLAEGDDILAAWKKAGSPGTVEDWVAQGVLSKLKVEVSQSSVIGVSYQASHSKYAAAVANAFAKAYVDTTLNLRVEPAKQASVWFDEQLKGLRSDLEAAQTKLAKFQREKGILATDERMDVESGRLAELSSQQLQASSTSYDNASRFGVSKGRSGETLPEVIANPLVQALKTELLRGESKLAELSSRLGPNHPQYVQQQQEVEALRSRVNSEIGKVSGGLATATAQARAREGALKAEYAAQRKRVEDLRDARAESMILQRDVDTAQKAYDSALARFHVNKIESGARQTNVTILNPAIEPTFPSRPRVPLNIALGFFVGTILGLAAIFLLEIIDRRVRSDPDLDGVMLGMDVPLLGTLQTWHPSRMLGGDDAPRALPSPA
ncbi:MAG TPA: chain length determinant protein EpsF [Usitatibacter sp.]|nr:chain length determinant protein EpsF [Usitatibacter sp.]